MLSPMLTESADRNVVMNSVDLRPIFDHLMSVLSTTLNSISWNKILSVQILKKIVILILKWRFSADLGCQQVKTADNVEKLVLKISILFVKIFLRLLNRRLWNRYFCVTINTCYSRIYTWDYQSDIFALAQTLLLFQIHK